MVHQLLIVTLLLLATAEKPIVVTFAKSDVGQLPAKWVASKTGAGQGSEWKVQPDNSAPSKSGFALTQTAEGPKLLYNLCWLDDSSFKDGELSVMVKALKGQVDQGGGLIWRCADANNYYVCRYNPMEENFRIYYVKGGKRTQLATKESVVLPDGAWFTVAVRHVGDRIECTLNGDHKLAVTDSTFADAGKIGLWTKADAVTAFDKLTVSSDQK